MDTRDAVGVPEPVSWGREAARCTCSLLSSEAMTKVLIFIFATLFGLCGWWLGAYLGLMGAWVISGLGSILGVYWGWRIGRDYF